MVQKDCFAGFLHFLFLLHSRQAHCVVRLLFSSSKRFCRFEWEHLLSALLWGWCHWLGVQYLPLQCWPGLGTSPSTMLTDQNCFLPWSCLSKQQQQELLYPLQACLVFLHWVFHCSAHGGGIRHCLRRKQWWYCSFVLMLPMLPSVCQSRHQSVRQGQCFWPLIQLHQAHVVLLFQGTLLEVESENGEHCRPGTKRKVMLICFFQQHNRWPNP